MTTTTDYSARNSAPGQVVHLPLDSVQPSPYQRRRACIFESREERNVSNNTTCPKCRKQTTELFPTHDPAVGAQRGLCLDCAMTLQSAAIDNAVRTIYAKHGKKPSCTVVDAIPCPACTTGTLRYRVSAYNGHITACCNTDGCLQWRS